MSRRSAPADRHGEVRRSAEARRAAEARRSEEARLAALAIGLCYSELPSAERVAELRDEADPVLLGRARRRLTELPFLDPELLQQADALFGATIAANTTSRSREPALSLARR